MRTALGVATTTENATATPGLGPFLQLLAVLHRTKGDSPECGIFAFTSATRGEGVSYVTAALANELAHHTRERVLLARAGMLASLTAHDVGDNRVWREVSPNLWRIDEARLDRTPGSELPSDVLTALRDRFTYILVDCRALEISPEILQISSKMDGVVLVVAAGQSHREQVQQAQRLLKLASDKLLGCVLNKQKLQKYRESFYGRTHDIAN